MPVLISVGNGTLRLAGPLPCWPLACVVFGPVTVVEVDCAKGEKSSDRVPLPFAVYFGRTLAATFSRSTGVTVTPRMPVTLQASTERLPMVLNEPISFWTECTGGWPLVCTSRLAP